ncbi:MAG: hypothetical protein RIS64_3990 [Bacteroidota bacterium]|jgi:hypothetical protein
MQKFINPNDPNNFQTIAWIEKQVRILLETEAGIISIEELSCHDSSCIHATSVICWANELDIQYFKISKPLVFIKKRDIELALKQSIFQKPLHQHF